MSDSVYELLLTPEQRDALRSDLAEIARLRRAATRPDPSNPITKENDQ